MPPEETSAVREDDRVTRLFPARVRDRGEALADVRVPSNDVGPGDRGRILFAEIEARLDASLEQRLCEPLSRIRTMTAVLNDEPSARHLEPLSAISEAAARSEGMLHDMLDFMRSAAGGLRIARRRVDLKVLCERVVDAIHTSYPDRPMLFTSDPHIEGEWDPDRMAMLLSKLVINAIEHGPVRPAIRVELHGLPEQAILQVWNAGAIPQTEPLQRLFEPFVCARGSEGLGLGLFLAQQVACAHGGRIDVRSTETDGTTFWVTVPRS
jgi:signal transduction histidine kinase